MTTREEDLLNTLRAIREALEATKINEAYLETIDVYINQLRRNYSNDRN